MGPLCGLSLPGSKTAVPQNEMEMELLLLLLLLLLLRKNMFKVT